MPTHHIDVAVTTPAPASAVYGLLRDGASWPEWSPIESFELIKKSDDGDEGVGAVRVFRTGRIRSQERIVELVPDRKLAYTLEKGLAIRGYRADVDLSESADGTTIRWRSSFDAKVPGTGGLYRRTLTRFIEQCASGLATYAASPAPPTSP